MFRLPVVRKGNLFPILPLARARRRRIGKLFGLPAGQVEGRVTLALKDKAKEGQKLYMRLAATDNRNVPEA